MDKIRSEEKFNQPVRDVYPDECAGTIITLDDSKVGQFYGSSTTQAYRLKSELVGKCIEEVGMGKFQWKLFVVTGFGWIVDNFASQGIGSIQPPIKQEFSDIVQVSYSSVAYYIGLILGASFWGISSDLIGRRPAFNCTLLIASIFLCAAAGSMNFVAFSALWAVIGTAAGGNVPIDSMIFLEFVPGSHQYLLTALSAWWNLSQLIVSLVSWVFLANFNCPTDATPATCSRHENMGWRYIMLTLGGIAFVFTFIRIFVFKLPETPRYLLSQGRDQDAVDAVNYTARQNGMPEPLTIGMLREIDARLGIVSSEGGERIGYPLYFNFLPSYLETKFTQNSSLYLTYRNYCITSAVGTVGPLSAAIMINTRLGRRYMMGISAIVTAVFLFAYVAVDNSASSLAFSCITSLLANFEYAIMYAFTPESFPAPHRGTGTGTAAALLRLGGLVASLISSQTGFTSAPIYASAAMSYGIHPTANSTMAGISKVFTTVEVAQHNEVNSCWVVLHGKVYDVTNLLASHPGGAQAILRFGGRDATEDFDLIHPPETLQGLQSALVGLLESDGKVAPNPQETTRASNNVDVKKLLNLDEIEQAATKIVSKKAWAYYYSAADDKISKRFNTEAYRSILLRPRVFVDCRKCDLETNLLGYKVDLPLYVSPTAMARLGHPAGEAGIAEACRAFGALQIIANNSSISPEQVVANASPTQVFGWQLYVQLDRGASEAMLARVNKLDAIKFIVLTIDAPVSGNREDDERVNLQENTAGSVSLQLFAGTDPSLTWHETLEWLSRHTKKPIILKGLQTHEDVAIAVRYSPLVKAVVLSNHGGRSLDTAQPAVHTLLEVHKYCPHIFKKMEVWVDGGVRRGTDAVKALCLGAKAVGIGRPALWGLGAGGVQGVERTLQILSNEMKTCMRLLGATAINDLGPHYVNTSMIEQQIYRGPPNTGDDPLIFKGRL
ncbi:Cytochrome b2, mitochondrial [Talaromyces islandicus]|uniref:L-lactate dehydrogenase (cytochrome) n=1 Tax=Talaromyces islandicus TaxID=28573 RepID=A0A0U1LWY7_TALIS|nr:Cytochrome b2, mitochondrial [Talaromyces islandicus]